MSNYNFKISDVSIYAEDELTVNCKIEGDSFPEPISSALILEGNVLLGNFTSSEGADLVTSFVFSYSGVPVNGEFLVEFQNLPEGYNGVNLNVTANLSMPNIYVLQMLQAETKKGKENDSGKTVRSRMSKTVILGDEVAIESYVLDSFEHDGQMREAADMELVEGEVSQLSGTCSDTIDFNSLTQPLLIAYHNQVTPDDKRAIGYIGITDN